MAIKRSTFFERLIITEIDLPVMNEGNEKIKYELTIGSYFFLFFIIQFIFALNILYFIWTEYWLYFFTTIGIAIMDTLFILAGILLYRSGNLLKKSKK